MTGAALVLAAAAAPSAQGWLAGVRQQVLDVLPYPAAAGLGRAADGNTTVEWVVNPPEGDAPGAPIEVVANRLNPVNQQKSAVHDEEMSSLQASLRVELRQADPRGLEEIDLAEARWSASRRLTVRFEVARAEPYTLDSSVSPFVTPVPGVAATVVAVRGNTYGYEATAGARRQRKWREAQARVFVGEVSEPSIARQAGYDAFDVKVGSNRPVLIVHLSGNEDLITHVIDSTDWAAVAKLVP
ncbi:MAG: hypothetical protein AB7O67_07090 [Vicinamibacterales bacterium]